MPTTSRRLTRSPSSVPNIAAKIGLVHTSATDAVVDVNDSEPIHDPKWIPSNTPDSTISPR